jgi:hypothetical protein
MKLYRPVGINELQLIYDTGMRAYPPRLPEQPIFYPVLNFSYAEQIARDWNALSGMEAGYVTEFELPDGYASRFERKVVGSRMHEELWVPAGELDELNASIVGTIAVSAAYFGPGFRGLIPADGALEGLDATGQLLRLADLLASDRAAFEGEVLTNHRFVFLHYPFWCRRAMGDVVAALRDLWARKGFPALPGSACP